MLSHYQSKWLLRESNPCYRRERAMSWPLDQGAIWCIQLNISSSIVLNSPSRTRTYDTSVNSRMLYRLSYWGMIGVFSYTFKTSYSWNKLCSTSKMVISNSLRFFSMSLCYANASSVSQAIQQVSLFIAFKPAFHFLRFWSSPRSISNSQLHVLLHFHLCPIYLVVFKGSYFFRRDISSWGGLHA